MHAVLVGAFQHLCAGPVSQVGRLSVMCGIWASAVVGFDTCCVGAQCLFLHWASGWVLDFYTFQEAERASRQAERAESEGIEDEETQALRLAASKWTKR